MGPSLFPPPWLAGPAAGADFLKSALATTTNPAKLSQITSYKLKLAVHSPGLILGLARNGPPAPVLGPTPPPVWLAGWSARRRRQFFKHAWPMQIRPYRPCEIYSAIASTFSLALIAPVRSSCTYARELSALSLPACMQIRCLWNGKGLCSPKSAGRVPL